MKAVILLAQAGERRSSFPISNSFFGARLVEAKAMPKLLFFISSFCKASYGILFGSGNMPAFFLFTFLFGHGCLFYHARLRPLDSPLLGLIAGIK